MSKVDFPIITFVDDVPDKNGKIISERARKRIIAKAAKCLKKRFAKRTGTVIFAHGDVGEYDFRGEMSAEEVSD